MEIKYDNERPYILEKYFSSKKGKLRTSRRFGEIRKCSCGKEFFAIVNAIKKGHAIFCSGHCRAINRKNIIRGSDCYNFIDGLSRTSERIIKRTYEWRKKNPLAYKAMQHRRRLLQRDLKVETVQLVYEDNIKKYGTLTCYLCLSKIEFGQDALEHKTPLSRGGSNSRDNLDIAHRVCNSRKRNKTEEEYRILVGSQT